MTTLPDPRYQIIRTGPVCRVLDRWVADGSQGICAFTGTLEECAAWVENR